MWSFACKGTLIIKIATQDLNPLSALPRKYSCERYIACYLELCLIFPFGKMEQTTLSLFMYLWGVLKRNIQRYNSAR